MPLFLFVGAMATSVLSSPEPATASPPPASGKMCGWDDATQTCASGLFDKSYHYVIDRPVHVFKPDPGRPPRNELVIFLHGCCGDRADAKITEVGNSFLASATAAGYHAISLDYFTDREFPNPGGNARDRCACDPNCSGYLFEQLWRGTPRQGLPTMDPREAIEHRLVKVLTWLTAHEPNGHWAQYLDQGAPNYAKIVMTGHSLGSEVATYVAKHVKLARAVMLAGPSGSTDHEAHLEPAAASWSYQQLTSTRCVAPYRPEDVRHTGQVQTAHWISDNHFGPNTGTVWKTPLDRIYSIRGACDDVMFNEDLATRTPYDKYTRAALKAWDTIHLSSLGAYKSVDTDSAPYGGSHGLVMGFVDESAPPYKQCKANSLCDGGHGSMLGGSCTPAEHTKLRHAWDYVLTH
jgi:dienelactone hydrolase